VECDLVVYLGHFHSWFNSTHLVVAAVVCFGRFIFNSNFGPVLSLSRSAYRDQIRVIGSCVVHVLYNVKRHI